MTCYVYHMRLTGIGVDSNFVSKFTIHIALSAWVWYLTNGHTLVPYFLNTTKYGCTTLRYSKLATKQAWTMKHQTSHTYKNIWMLKINVSFQIHRLFQVAHTTVAIVGTTKHICVHKILMYAYPCLVSMNTYSRWTSASYYFVIYRQYMSLTKELQSKTHHPVKQHDSQFAIPSVHSPGAVFC